MRVLTTEGQRSKQINLCNLYAARTLAVAGLFLFSVTGSARPRVPLPSILGVGITYHERFDAPFFAGTTNSEVFVTNCCTLHESWSGYALERAATGVGLIPFAVEGVDGVGHTNVSSGSAAAALRFWVTPHWSSASITNGTGPGNNARLAELLAVGTNPSNAVSIWSLQIVPDGSAVSLVSESDSGPLELLRADIAWAAQSTHCIALNFGT